MAKEETDGAIDWNQVRLILASGGAGGLLSWTYGYVVKQPIDLAWWQAIPGSILLGMGAAYVGIYVLANTDTRQLARCMGFAILCGISWKPVYDAGSALVEQTTAHKEDQANNESARTSAESLDQLVEATATNPSPSKTTSLVNLTLEALQKLPKIKDPKTREVLQLATVKAVGEISRQAATQPSEAAVDALQTIGTEAVKNGDAASTALAMSQLHALTTQPGNPTEKIAAQKGLEHIQLSGRGLAVSRPVMPVSH